MRHRDVKSTYQAETPLADGEFSAAGVPVPRQHQYQQAWNQSEYIAKGCQLLHRVTIAEILDDDALQVKQQYCEQDIDDCAHKVAGGR